MKSLEQDIIDVLIKHKRIDEHSLRNFRVKTRYKELRELGMSGKDARSKIAKEEFISEKNVQYILYRKN